MVIIEKAKLGGTCVVSGCTPTKTYIASARRMWETNHLEEYGVVLNGETSIDFKQVKARKDKIVDGIIDGIEKEYADNKMITLVRGEAKFISDYEVSVGENRYSAKKIIINTGARARVPEEFKSSDYLTKRKYS